MKHRTEIAEGLQDAAEGLRQARDLLDRINDDMFVEFERLQVNHMRDLVDLASYLTRDPQKITDDAWMRRQAAELFPQAKPPQAPADPKQALKQTGRSKTLPMSVTIPPTKTVAELISLLRLNGFSISTMQQQKGSDS